MKTKCLLLSLVSGLLAAGSAHAFPGGTHDYNYYRAVVLPKMDQAKTEKQVAVMVQAPAPGSASYSPWYKATSRSCATHGR